MLFYVIIVRLQYNHPIVKSEFQEVCSVSGRTLPQVLTEQAAILGSNLREGVSPPNLNAPFQGVCSVSGRSERVRDPRDLRLPRLVGGSRTRSEPRGEASCMEHDIVKVVIWFVQKPEKYIIVRYLLKK
jgi:hypothetical protein